MLQQESHINHAARIDISQALFIVPTGGNRMTELLLKSVGQKRANKTYKERFEALFRSLRKESLTSCTVSSVQQQSQDPTHTPAKSRSNSYTTEIAFVENF